MSLTSINITNMKKLITLIVVVTLSGCNTHNAAEKMARMHISEIEALIEPDSTKGEDFLSFFEQFKKDTLFQQERVCVPFKQLNTFEYRGTGGLKDSTIVGNDKRDWPFYSFLVDDSINYSHQDLNIKNDTVEVSLSMDPPTFDPRSVQAIFIRKKGKWFGISFRIMSYGSE